MQIGKPQLYPHQVRALDWLAEHPKGWLAMEQGTGKTAPAILDAKLPAVAVVPAYLVCNWQRELAMWRPEASVIVNQIDLQKDFSLLSYHRFIRYKSPLACRTLIFDEGQNLASPRAKRTKVAARWADSTEFVRLLSGTPIPARPMNLWAMAYAIGATKLKWREWGFKYCGGYLAPWGAYNFNGASNLEELALKLQPWMFRLLKSEVLELPDKQRRLIALSGKLDWEDRKFSADDILAHPNPISFIGLSEAMSLHGMRKAELALEYILNVLEDEPRVVIFARHIQVVGYLYQMLLAAGKRVGVITGATRPAIRQGLVDSFQGGGFDVLLGNIQAMGVGLTLTKARYAIILEASWSDAENVQAEDRLHRIGQTLPVQIDYLVVDRSLDAAVIEKLLFKRALADTLLDRESRLRNLLIN